MVIEIKNGHFELDGERYEIETSFQPGKTILKHYDFMCSVGDGSLIFPNGGYLAIQRKFRQLDHDRIIIDME